MTEFYEDNRGPGRPPKYPFRRMEVGDVVRLFDVTQRQIGKRIQDYKPLKFKTRTIMHGGKMAVKVERLA